MPATNTLGYGSPVVFLHAKVCEVRSIARGREPRHLHSQVAEECGEVSMAPAPGSLSGRRSVIALDDGSVRAPVCETALMWNPSLNSV